LPEHQRRSERGNQTEAHASGEDGVVASLDVQRGVELSGTFLVHNFMSSAGERALRRGGAGRRFGVYEANGLGLCSSLDLKRLVKSLRII
jgi:hypothetical protein